MTCVAVAAFFFRTAALMNRPGLPVLGEPSDFLQNESEAKIPKIVHLTALKYPSEVVANNKLYMEAGTEFRFYDDAAMEASTQQISEELSRAENMTGVYDAFAMLRPMAFRADLWRYLILWQHGGIYMDDKLMMTSQSTAWLDRFNEEMVTVRDRFADKKNRPRYLLEWPSSKCTAKSAFAQRDSPRGVKYKQARIQGGWRREQLVSLYHRAWCVDCRPRGLPTKVGIVPPTY